MTTIEDAKKLALQQSFNPQLVSAGMPQRDESFDRWRHEIEDLLTEKEYNIRGYFWDPDAVDPANPKKKGTWVQKGEPRCNEIGAKVIRNAMSSVVNKISTLTVLDIDEINTQIRIMVLNLNRLFYLNHAKYKLKSPTDARNLLWDIGMFCFNGLKQSEGGASLKALAEMSQTIRHEGFQDQKKGGMFGIFKRGGG